MPKELIAVAARTPAIREYDDPPLKPGEIRVKTCFAAPKHGTEMHMYRGDGARMKSRWDPDNRIYLPFESEEERVGRFPVALGNMAAGQVIEIGPGTDGIEIGDWVAGYGRLRETQNWTWKAAGGHPDVRRIPTGMSLKTAVCLDPATVALGGIRDGHVRVGDRVAVFGLGAIGLLAVQIAKVAGASLVVAIDPIAGRRDVAKVTGADMVLDPTRVDAGLEVRRATNMIGVDVSIETSGAASALHHSIRGLAFGGTVALTAVYNEFQGGLDLGREAHRNRPTFVFTRAESEPHRDHPRWDKRRLVDAAWDLLTNAHLNCEQIVQPVVAFDEAEAAYRDIDEHPEHSVKLGVRFQSDSGSGRT